MFFDFAQHVGVIIHGGKELPIKSFNNEVIRIFSETDELIVFVNSLVEVTEILDGRTTVENSGREDGEKTIDFCRGGRGFKDGGETKEGVCEFPIVFGDKRFDKKLIYRSLRPCTSLLPTSTNFMLDRVLLQEC